MPVPGRKVHLGEVKKGRRGLAGHIHSLAPIYPSQVITAEGKVVMHQAMWAVPSRGMKQGRSARRSGQCSG